MGISEQELRNMVGDKRANEILGKNKKQNQSQGKRRGIMNKTEQEYYEKFLLTRDDVVAVHFEPITFRLNNEENRKYTPDFMVTTQTTVEIHEIKGAYERRDGRTRFLWATDLYWMFEWYYAQKKRDGWNVERIN